MEPEQPATWSAEELLDQVRHRGDRIRQVRRVRWVTLVTSVAILAAGGAFVVPGLFAPASTKLQVGAVGPATPVVPTATASATPVASPSPTLAVGIIPSTPAPKPSPSVAASPKITAAVPNLPWSVQVDGCVPPVLHAAPDPENLQATALPPGFSYVSGDPTNPGSMGVRYADGTNPNGRFFTLHAQLDPGPATDDTYLGLTSTKITTTVDAVQVVVGTNMITPPGTNAGIIVAFKPTPYSVADVYATGMTVNETELVAPGVVFTGGLYPAQTPACSPTAPVVEGAIAQATAMAKVPGAHAAKLVRESDVARDLNQDECGTVGDQNGCDPAVVEWALVSPECGGGMIPVPAQPGASPLPDPSPSPTGTCWTITEINAATGVASGAYTSGNGALPAWWGQLHDYSSDPTVPPSAG